MEGEYLKTRRATIYISLANVIGSINTYTECFLLHFLPITSDFHSQDALAGMQSRQDGTDDFGQISLLLLLPGSKYPLFFLVIASVVFLSFSTQLKNPLLNTNNLNSLR